jgi:hypothetical protein
MTSLPSSPAQAAARKLAPEACAGSRGGHRLLSRYGGQMALDAALLSAARAAETRMIDAEHLAETARAEFHRTVRRLQLEGGSLREIAEALGLSHQRVHQIVEAAGGSRRWRHHRGGDLDLLSCSFCGASRKRVKVLVGGPGVYICDTCTAGAVTVLAAAPGRTGRAAPIQPAGDEARTERCSFCGNRRYQASGMAAARGIRICGECLQLCEEICRERTSGPGGA